MQKLSNKQKARHARLTKRYQALGVSPGEAAILARCVMQKRGGYGLFRALGVPVKGERVTVEARSARAKKAVWEMRREVAAD